MASKELVKAPQSEAIERVLIGGDLSALNEDQRLAYYKKVCDSCGLNYLTVPFQYIRLNGKLVLYASKNCTDQLRMIHGISVTEVSNSHVEDVYVVCAKVLHPTGRTDIGTGAVTIGGLKGDALANALMKAETKAKRRATLSICGLSVFDEMEIETIPNAKPYSPDVAKPESVTIAGVIAEEYAYGKKGYFYKIHDPIAKTDTRVHASTDVDSTRIAGHVDYLVELQVRTPSPDDLVTTKPYVELVSVVSVRKPEKDERQATTDQLQASLADLDKVLQAKVETKQTKIDDPMAAYFNSEVRDAQKKLEDKRKAATGTITKDQLTRLWTIAGKANLSTEQVKQIAGLHGWEGSSKEMPEKIYDGVIEEIETYAKFAKQS